MSEALTADVSGTSGKSVESNSSTEIVSGVSLISKDRVAPPIETFLLPQAVTEAEILWCLATVSNHVSKRGAASLAKGFPRLFWDSEIAKKCALSRSKISYCLTFGLSPYFADELRKSVSDASFFVVLFDESLNKIAQRGQMDVHIRFCINDTVKTRYLTSVFLGRATSEDLLRAFTGALQELSQKKMLQISMDGPNVNTKFLRLFIENRDPTFPDLLDCGSCSLHVVCGSLKHADEKNFKIGKFLMAIYYVFKDSPMRRALFLSYNDLQASDFPLKFCPTRWVENVRVASRALHLIPLLRKFVLGVTSEKKKPTSNSYENMESALTDILLSAKLAFFIRVASILEKFLKSYQTDWPMTPFMYDDVQEMMLQLARLVVKPSVLDGKKDKQLCKIDLRNTNNLIDALSIDLGFAVGDQIGTCREQLKKNDIVRFKTESRMFVTDVLQKLQLKSPLQFNMVKGASCINPSVMVNDGLRTSRITCALEEMVSKSLISGVKADNIKQEYLVMCRKSDVHKKLEEYNRQGRLDSFLFPLLLNNDASDDLRSFVTQILCLSHGQASVERGFNINKEMLVENQIERSLIAQRVVHDALESSGVSWHEFPICKALVSSFRRSHQRYLDAISADKVGKSKEDQAAAEIRAATALTKKRELELKRRREELKEELARMDEELREHKRRK